MKSKIKQAQANNFGLSHSAPVSADSSRDVSPALPIKKQHVGKMGHLPYSYYALGATALAATALGAYKLGTMKRLPPPNLYAGMEVKPTPTPKVNKSAPITTPTPTPPPYATPMVGAPAGFRDSPHYRNRAAA